MPLEMITNRNLSEGFHVLFVYVNDVTGGIFINLLLFMIWSVVTFGLFFTKKKLEGDGNFPACMAVGSFITTIFTVLFGLINGLVNVYTYAIVIVVTLVSVMFFMYGRD